MKNLLFILLSLFILTSFISCTENYQNGERVGTISKFNKHGLKWKSYEGELHVTQTGMNSTNQEFDFSVDNDQVDTSMVRTLDSALNLGWKVRIKYHETFGKNWFDNRGATDNFITSVKVEDRNFNSVFTNRDTTGNSTRGRVIDTVYVVIDRSQLKRK